MTRQDRVGQNDQHKVEQVKEDGSSFNIRTEAA